MKRTKEILILIIAVFSFNFIYGQTLSKQKHTLNTALSILKSDQYMKNAGIGFYAVDMNTGEVLSAYNEEMALTPASIMKLISSATALEYLGPEFRYETKLEYTGYIDKQTHILNGNIIIKGGGDPSLGSKHFSGTADHLFLDQWVKELSRLGIKYINGNIIGDAGLYGIAIAPRTWSWEDIGNYYGAGACGLNIYDNFYTLYFTTGSTVGSKTKITKIEPDIPGLSLTNLVTSDAIHNDMAYIFGSPYTYYKYVQGELPLNKTNFEVKGAIPDPPYFTAYELKRKLKEAGIGSGKATTFRLSPELENLDTVNLVLNSVIKSPPLKEIIKKTNFHSINFFAEHLFKHAQLKACNFNLNKIDKKFVENFWRKKGVHISGMRVNDGSGLSRHDKVTAKHLVSILLYMKKRSKYSEYFYESIPVVGKDGTVRNICKGTSAANNMRAKSGSFGGVRAYAGYVTTKSGRSVAFTLIINNYNSTSTYTRKKMEKLMAAIADFNL